MKHIQVTEATIVQDMVNIFTPLSVEQMENDLVAKIASESLEHQTRRELLEQKLNILKKGMEICKRHASYQDNGKLFHCKQ